MNPLIILAQAAETSTHQPPPSIIPTDAIWSEIIKLNVVEALTFLSFGIVCYFYGWRIFRILVTIIFALIGLCVGIWLNKTSLHTNGIWAGIILMVVAAALAAYLVKWGVGILGAVAGAVITGGIWYACNLPEQYLWAGALIGLVTGSMISIVVFKGAVMLFTSLTGSALIAAGVLAILCHQFDATERIKEYFFNYRWFLPVILLVPTLIGITIQYALIKKSSSFEI